MSRLKALHTTSLPLTTPLTAPSTSTTTSTATPTTKALMEGAWAQESQVAARWWRDLLAKHGSVSEGMADIFYDHLVVRIARHVSEHWYPEEPLRGQAYRSISVDTQNDIEKILLDAANKSRIHIQNCWPKKVQHLVMWIDPGEVVIKIYNDKSRAIEDVIFEKSYNSLEANLLQTYSLSALTERLLAVSETGESEYDLYTYGGHHPPPPNSIPVRT
eukprot:TRINITY_DN542_c0_g1_i1.p1 TRINITY_DN542_c0_g1~~TRINITY_DN542_c0_g1_i1.p1  ORF type:complete len:224 (-),score=40.91 TRINITY_DN542_c0_g1_i1:469-1119(-)